MMAVMHIRLVVAAMTSQSHQSEANVLIFFIEDESEPPEAVILLFTLSSSGVSADCSDSIAVPLCRDVFPMVDYLRCIQLCGRLLMGHAWQSPTYGTINILYVGSFDAFQRYFLGLLCTKESYLKVCYDSLWDACF